MRSETDEKAAAGSNMPPLAVHNHALRIISKIHGLGRHQDLHACRNCDHVAAFTARSQAGSIPGAARTTAPPISIVIAVAPRTDAAAIVPSWRSSITTGTNSGALSAGKLSKPARAALRQANRCCGEYRFGAPPPTRPRRAHRIPRPFVPWPRHSSDADAPPPPGYRPCHVPPKFQLYGQPYMRLHISNVGHIVPVKSRVTRWGRRTAYEVWPG
jgi:hypothetical protein